jgi:hypothetical protein
MSSTVKEVLKQALELDEADRASVAGALIEVLGQSLKRFDDSVSARLPSNEGTSSDRD